MWISEQARAGETVVVGFLPEKRPGAYVFGALFVRANVKHAVHGMIGPDGERITVVLPEELRTLSKDQRVYGVSLKEAQT